jgi:hypothetical protein
MSDCELWLENLILECFSAIEEAEEYCSVKKNTKRGR